MGKVNQDFRPEELSTELSLQAKAVIRRLLDKHFIISDFTKSEESYANFIDKMLKYMTYGFEHKKFRDCPVKFKFHDDPNEEMKWLPFRHFIINIIMWYPIAVTNKDKLDDDKIIPSAKMKRIGASMVKEYIDTEFIEPNEGKISNHDMNDCLTETIYWLGQISSRFNMFMGVGLNLEAFIDLAKRNPRFNELLHFKLDENKQPADIEADMKKAAKEQIDIILNDEQHNILKPLLQPDSGTKRNQFTNFALVGGLKPSCNGKTIRKPINTNYVTGCIDSITDYYINSNPGRNAAITNHDYMGIAGHLLNLCMASVAGIKLSKTVEDCHSPNPIDIEITSEEHLNRLIGRYYYTNGSQKLNKITKHSKDLIGQRVLLRSPTKCCAKDGVCKICYGDLYNVNISLNCVGIYSAIRVMNPVTQTIVGAKHHQTTNSVPMSIKPTEVFDKYFSISSTDIIINRMNSDLYNVYLVIKREDLFSVDEDNEPFLSKLFKTDKKKRKSTNVNVDNVGDSDEEAVDIGTPYYVNKFYLHFKDTDEFVELKDDSGLELFIHENLLLQMTPILSDGDDRLELCLESIDENEFVFIADVINNDVIKPMKMIRDLVNTRKHLECQTIDDMIQKMLDLLIESGIQATSVHGEMLIYPLIRKSTDRISRPDFSRVLTSSDYQILTIESSLKCSPSITTSLSSTRIKQQIVSMMDTYDKTATSPFDPMFKLRLSDD